MPSGSIEEEDGVTALRYLAADLLEVQVHRLRVGIRQDQGRTDVAMRADGAEYVGPRGADPGVDGFRARPRRESMCPADPPGLHLATKVQLAFRAHVRGSPR